MFHASDIFGIRAVQIGVGALFRIQGNQDALIDSQLREALPLALRTVDPVDLIRLGHGGHVPDPFVCVGIDVFGAVLLVDFAHVQNVLPDCVLGGPGRDKCGL